MKLNLLKILSEEIKEQGFGRYYADITLPSGKKAGDIEGFDFEKMTTIDKKEIPFGKTDVISTQTDETLMGDDLLSEKIVIDAESSLGTKYCYGGVDPEGGIDCSAFIWHFYKENGISIPRTARDQYKKAKKLSKEELRIGDLIFFENTQSSLPAGEASHVGFIHKIYPDGKIDMLHSGTSNGVSIVKDVLNNSYHKKHFLGFGRLLEDSPDKVVVVGPKLGGGSFDIKDVSTVYPLEKKYPVNRDFGMDFHPIHKKYKMHQGVDVACPTGTKVRSIANGEVVRSDMNDSKGYGNFIVVKHNINGEVLYSAYAHLSKRNVNVGDKVKKGDIIGISGATGGVTGPHLHFEIRKSLGGDQIQPIEFLNTPL